MKPMTGFTHAFTLRPDYVSRGRSNSWQARSTHAATRITLFNPYTKRNETGYLTVCGKEMCADAAESEDIIQVDGDARSINCKRCLRILSAEVAA